MSVKSNKLINITINSEAKKITKSPVTHSSYTRSHCVKTYPAKTGLTVQTLSTDEAYIGLILSYNNITL